MLWDSKDLAFTTHRLIFAMLVLSTLVDYCCPWAPPRRMFANPIVDGVMTSIFYKPHNLLHDLVFETTCVYPALVEMSRIIPKLQSGSLFCTGDETCDYILACFLLIFVIGGGSNVLATRIAAQGTTVTGFSPVVGAALGYYQRITIVRNTVLLSVLGHKLTAIQVYWTSIAWMIMTYSDWYPRLVAWLIGGLAGSFLAKYHMENIVFWGEILNFFGLT